MFLGVVYVWVCERIMWVQRRFAVVRRDDFARSHVEDGRSSRDRFSSTGQLNQLAQVTTRVRMYGEPTMG